VTGVGGALSTFPNFLVYFAIGGALTALFVMLYINLTPQHDLRLIRGGNSAAAIALVGALIGFVVPLASVIAHSAGIVELVVWGIVALVVWGIVALVVQLAGFIVARLVLPHLPQAIEAGNVADAVLLAGISLSLGVLDAACMAG
jgi:putative membrane protein